MLGRVIRHGERAQGHAALDCGLPIREHCANVGSQRNLALAEKCGGILLGTFFADWTRTNPFCWVGCPCPRAARAKAESDDLLARQKEFSNPVSIFAARSALRASHSAPQGMVHAFLRLDRARFRLL